MTQPQTYEGNDMAEIIGSILTTLIVIAVIAAVAWSRYGNTVQAIWHAITGREPD